MLLFLNEMQMSPQYDRPIRSRLGGAIATDAYSDRKKFNKSCFCPDDSPLKD